MILGDGVIGQMMEGGTPPCKNPVVPKKAESPLRLLGYCKPASGRVILSHHWLLMQMLWRRFIHLQKKYSTIEAEEARYETYKTEDADHLIVAFGCMSRICENVVELARQDGIKQRITSHHSTPTLKKHLMHLCLK